MRNGYTFLELLVVLVIMALLLGAVPALSLPVLNSFRFSGKLQAQAALLQAAHARALGDGVVVTVDGLTFYPDGSSSGGDVRVSFAGRSRTLTVNAVTGEVDGAY